MAAPKRRLQPARVADVRIDDAFFTPRQRANVENTVPHGYRMNKKTGRIDAFHRRWTPGRPHPFWDSDVAKWMEGAAYTLMTHPNPKLERQLDGIIDLIAASQEPDGYINSYFTVVQPENRWTWLAAMHELYCAGHLFEAAVACHQATGKTKFLDVACRFAEHIADTFGRGKGQTRGYPGHPEIELALVRLYHETGAERYLKLAAYFVDERGRRPFYFVEEGKRLGKEFPEADLKYSQSQAPVREQQPLEGHAVRAAYLLAGVVDVAADTHDADLWQACRRLWDSAVHRRMYVHGGIGSTFRGEAFSFDYDLPNETAYAETCAAIALCFVAQRMLAVDPRGAYADVLERALYNNVAAGVSRDGMKFFYVNPLSVEMRRRPHVLSEKAFRRGTTRQEWFDCACCPTNIVRILGALGSYAYSTSPAAAYVHLYVGGEATLQVGRRQVRLTQETQYPWEGKVRIRVDVDAPGRFSLLLRIPGWCRSHTLKARGQPADLAMTKGYARLQRRWEGGETIELEMDMPVERVAAHPYVADDRGKVALQRGPIVYCLEECDHKADVHSIELPDDAKLTPRWRPRLLGGCTVLEGQGLDRRPQDGKAGLYEPADAAPARPVKITAVPYCLWNNRRAGDMTVWLPRA